MNTCEKITALRVEMEKAGIAALIVPSADPHQSEYVAAHWQARRWLTGFTGSAGTAVLTMDQALLWTDFRYWTQAEAQMDGFELRRQGANGVPSFDRWLVRNLTKGDRVGVDGRVISMADARTYRRLFEGEGLAFETRCDLISPLWTERPAMPSSSAFVLEDRYVGATRLEKFAAVRKHLLKDKASSLLMTSLDDIAWTFNLRGDDVHTNPVNLAFALILEEQVRLFINPVKLPESVGAALEADGVVLSDYDAVDAALKEIEDNTRILLDADRTSIHLANMVNPRAVVVERTCPAVALKAVKNETEIRWQEKTAVKDGRAMVNFLYWLEHEASEVTELSAARKLNGFRAAEEHFFADSFDAIMAAGDHSAMCHYAPGPDTDRPITDQALFLTDSGGNYLTGTTDITRTLHLGTPSDREIRDYTLVLKGHIAVARCRFPEGTRGYQVDTLARQFLWQEGMDFGHGTGHGIGFFLCVHEGPARISPSPVDEVLKPGMVLSNEPGLYRDGAYGIRLENMEQVVPDGETPFGRFLRFEPLTLCHFESGLIDRAMLTDEERAWVDAYHLRVYEALAPGLVPAVADWLREKTRPL